MLASPRGRVYRTRKFLRRHRAAALGTAAGLVFLLLIGVTAWSLSRRDSPTRPTLTEKDTIVLADFTNQTGDPVFDDALRQGLSFELEQSPFTVISDRKVQQMLALMGQSKDARVTPEIAQQICERTASAMILEGSIASLGSQYVLGLRARNCTTGSILDQQQIQAARQEDVLDALSQIARRFRTRAGESLATVEKHATLPEYTTRSIEALKAYSIGQRTSYFFRQCRGNPFFAARRRNRSRVRDGARPSGALLQRRWGISAVGREHHESLAPPGPRERSRKVLHRLCPRPSGDGKPGKGLPNPRVVASDVSPRGTTKSP